MRKILYTVLFSVLFSVFGYGQKSFGLVGGNVFDGSKFVKKDLFIVGGKITFTRPDDLQKTLLIENEFIIPPYGDAHTHNLDRKWQLGYLPDQYLQEGTFYVQNLTAKTENIEFFKNFFITAESPDVKFANQGLSTTIGHPFMAYEPYVMGLNDANKWKENIERINKSRLDEGNSYIFINSKKEAKEKLKGYFAGKPDIVKIFLVEVENFATNSVDEIPGNNGLSPELAKYITKESHKRGLKVYAHINTARDFEVGVEAGVDGFAHIPAWDGKPETKEKYTVSEKVLKKAVSKNIAVIPTIANTMGSSEQGTREYRDRLVFLGDLIKRYHQLGGKVLIGSDYFNRPLAVELKAFIESGAFSAAELLKIVSETTPRAIFPERKIGLLKEDFEASVLVLEGDPLKDANNLFSIKHRIKQGNYIKFDKE